MKDDILATKFYRLLSSIIMVNAFQVGPDNGVGRHWHCACLWHIEVFMPLFQGPESLYSAYTQMDKGCILLFFFLDFP